jgi:DNA-directed RNA polymerase subunit RPC12/RpoP
MQLAVMELSAFLERGVTCPNCSSRLSSKDGTWSPYPLSAYLEGVYELACPRCGKSHNVPIKKVG